MAEFFEIPVRREDGAEALHYVNVEAISYLDYQVEGGEKSKVTLKVHLHNGYWFTLSGEKAEEVLNLVKARGCIQFKDRTGEN